MSDAKSVKLGAGVDVRIDGELFHILEAGNGIVRYEVDHSENKYTETSDMFRERLTQGQYWKVYHDGVDNGTENYVAGRGKEVIS